MSEFLVGRNLGKCARPRDSKVLVFFPELSEVPPSVFFVLRDRTMDMEQQEQDPFLPVKDHNGTTGTKWSSVVPFMMHSNWKSFRGNCMIHSALIALYTICSIAAIYTLRKPYSQKCK